MPGFEREGVAVFAISYDSVSVLAEFARKRGITYNLLSDEGSETIRALGLYNEHVEQQHAHYGVQLRSHHYGIAYPGVFFLDERGIIVDRRFEQSYRVRPLAASVLEDLAGTEIPPAVQGQVTNGEVELNAWMTAATYRPYQLLRLHFALVIRPDLHVYGKPVPDWLTPLQVTVEPSEKVTVRSVELPRAVPRALAGFDESFPVHEGTVTGSVDLILLENLGETELGVSVSFQTCSETLCNPPAELVLPLSLQGQENIRD